MAELQQKGCQPTIGEIAEQVGVKPAKVKKVLLESRQPFSLEESLEGEKEVDPYEVIADQDLLSPEENFSRAQLIKMIKRAFINDVLNPKEALVLKLRYGFGDEGEACTLREVGKRLNLSHERIRQLEEMGLAKLKFLLSR